MRDERTWMSSRWLLPPVVGNAYAKEVALSRAAERRGDLPMAWRHLERAHILGLVAVWPHIGVHARMLRFSILHWNRQEVAGQLVRIVIAGPGSYSGRAPLGDTGASNAPVPPVPVPEDLRSVLLAGGLGTAAVAGSA